MTDLAGTILFGLSWWCPPLAFLVPFLVIAVVHFRYTQQNDDPRYDEPRCRTPKLD